MTTRRSRQTGIHIRTVHTTPAVCRRILTSALEAGSYGTLAWARVSTFDRPRRPNEASVEATITTAHCYRTRKGWITSVRLENREEPRKRFRREVRSSRIVYGAPGAWITVPALQWAVQQILRDPQRCEVGRTGVGRIISQDWDGPLCDAVVQVACFGRVIYG